jgi:hypothetical protein
VAVDADAVRRAASLVAQEVPAAVAPEVAAEDVVARSNINSNRNSKTRTNGKWQRFEFPIVRV